MTKIILLGFSLVLLLGCDTSKTQREDERRFGGDMMSTVEFRGRVVLALDRLASKDNCTVVLNGNSPITVEDGGTVTIGSDIEYE